MSAAGRKRVEFDTAGTVSGGYHLGLRCREPTPARGHSGAIMKGPLDPLKAMNRSGVVGSWWGALFRD